MINTVKSLVEPAALRFISYIHRNEAFHADPLVSRTYFSSSFDQMTGEKFHFPLGLGKISCADYGFVKITSFFKGISKNFP